MGTVKVELAPSSKIGRQHAAEGPHIERPWRAEAKP
jgi:hypothetical protein